MKLSTTTAIYRDRPSGKGKIPVIDCVEKLYEIGYRDVDINFNMMSKRELELSREDWERWGGELAEVLDCLGMTSTQCHVPFYNVLKPDSIPNREHTEEIIRRAIVTAGKIGVRAVVFHGGTWGLPVDQEKSLEGNVEYFKPHAELACRYNMSIAVENLPEKKGAGSKGKGGSEKDGSGSGKDRNDTDDNGERSVYTARLEEVLELCEKLRKGYGNAGICWDFGHANLMSCDQVQALEQIGDRLIAVHVSDNYGIHDDHALPYQGNIQWEPILRTLKKIGYQGAFAYETHKLTAYMPDEMVDETLRYTFRLGTYLMTLAERER